jgi:hypothetical protein
MDTKTLTVPVIVTLLAGGMFITGKYVEQQDYSPVLISVDGRGEVNASPDIAQLSFGVQTERHPTAEEAMTELSEKMNAIVDAVKALDIEEKDIVTQNLSLYPSYDWNEGVREDQGFEANQSLSVKVRDLDKIGAVLSAATTAGANQAGGVSFTIDDPEELQAQARELAIKDAEAKAKVLAAQLGKRLGDIKSYSEGGYGGTPPMPYMAREAVMMDVGVEEMKAVPVPTGEQEIVISVNLTYEVR